MIDVIFGQLISNQDYFGKVWPYLSEEYFEKGPCKNVFNLIKNHVDSYNSPPSKVALNLAIENSNFNAIDYKGVTDLISQLKLDSESTDWTVPETEKFIKHTAIHNATMKIIQIQTNADKPKELRNKKLPDIGSIPEIMREALSVSFDSSIGHDWINDAEARWLMYQNKTNKIPFKQKILQKITKGGVEDGTLNILLGGVNTGKSMGLCSLAADYMQMGHDVLYISMEMAEEVVAKRIDANLLDITMDDLSEGHVSYSEYINKLNRWKASGQLGQLRIRQYPIGGANALTFKSLLNELKLKKNFKPRIIIVDYLGICASSRIKTFSENSYVLVKAIAEELRALAVEEGVPIWTGAQTTRGGWDNTDITMSDIAESAGLAATGDFILAVIETEELAQQGVQLFKQIKSRYGDKMMNNKFQLGVKKANQRWYEIDGPSSPKIPNISEDQIKNYLIDASKSIPVTKESIELDKMANELFEVPEEPKSPTNLQKVHKVQAPGRSELDDFVSSLKF